jgi:hypothetical protein
MYFDTPARKISAAHNKRVELAVSAEQRVTFTMTKLDRLIPGTWYMDLCRAG